MRVELPELKRCCCCLPLRRGLIFWIYLKMIFGALVMTYCACAHISNIPKDHVDFLKILISTLLIVITIDIAFCILFAVSAHRKKHEHMRIYYRYALCMLIFCIIAVLGFIGLEIFLAVMAMPYTFFFIYDMAQYTCLLFLYLVLQAYFVVLVRSEILKLERGAKFEFTNHTSEPVCKAQIIV